MIVELGICVFSDAIREDYTSPSFNLKMTQHIIAARLTHAILSAETTGAMKNEIVFFFCRHVTKLKLHVPALSLSTMCRIYLIIKMKTPSFLSAAIYCALYNTCYCDAIITDFTLQSVQLTVLHYAC